MSVSVDVSVLSTAAALQGKPCNAANTTLMLSQLSWVVFSSQAIGVQKGKGKAIDLASETSCKQL